MSAVVSFGSVNVDQTAPLSSETVTALSAQYDWFPAPGETVAVDGVPAAIDQYVEATYLGGKGANQAVAAANAGAETAFCGTVGTDAAEYAVLETLRGRGVGVDAVGQADCETGKAYVFVTDGGASRIAIIDGANGRVDPTYVTRCRETIADARCLLLQNEIPARTGRALLDELRTRPESPTVILDPAPTSGVQTLVEHDEVDIVVPNEHEATVLAESLASFSGNVIRTRGQDPITVTTAAGAQFEVTPPPVDPVDTTGAGDVFNGYLGARLAAGGDLQAAIETAATAAAVATTEHGAQRAIPTLEATRRFGP